MIIININKAKKDIMDYLKYELYFERGYDNLYENYFLINRIDVVGIFIELKEDSVLFKPFFNGNEQDFHILMYRDIVDDEKYFKDVIDGKIKDIIKLFQ